jgi:PAS domain S-box-containing protein
LHFLGFGILYTAVYLACGFALGGHPYVRTVIADALLIALVLGICGVIFRRRRDWEGTHRVFWDVIAAGSIMWCVGEVGFTITSITESRSWVQWHTMFSLCGGIGPVVALLARPYLGTRKSSSWGIGIDLASYATLMMFVYAYFIMVPSVVPAGARPSPQSILLTLVQIQRLILFGGLAASAWFARDTSWARPMRAMAIATGFGFFLRLVTSAAISAGSYYEGSVYDLAWIVPYLGFLWAALESPRSTGDAESIPQPRGWSTVVISTVPVLLIPTIGFGLLGAQPIGDPGDSVRLLLTTLSMVAGLGLLTLRLSVQSGELQRADAQMRLLAAATEQTGDLILITRANGIFEHANDACIQALGYTRDELNGVALPILLERGFERMVDHIGTEVRTKGVWRGTLIHRRKDGTTFPASATVVALRNSDARVTHFVGVERDITDELKLRDQLVHSERLSAVGELVAGVAHEINNPLQTIIGSVELMLEERDGDHTHDLEVVRQEATRAGQIVRNLLAFVRKSSSDRTRVDLNQIADATARLRSNALKHKNIALEMALHPGPLAVLVNREEIQQVVLNLVLNAEHAIGDRQGRIVIRTDAGEHAHTLQVTDDGPGISQELRGRVFEPFFTTKEVGQGTGLGLSLGLGIATAHGGSLELCPPSGRGACFRLTLPAQSAENATGNGQVPATRRRAERRQALVIEDEPPIRELLVRLLKRRDYAVTEAASYREAKALSDGKTLDLVLCDVRLEDGSGAELLRHLTGAQPAIGRRFIFVTGDAGAIGDQRREFAGIPVLTKPFTASDFERVLGDVEVGV